MNLYKILTVVLFINISNQITSDTLGAVIHKWEVLNITFRTQNDYENPYADIPVNKNDDLLKVIFTGTGGNALDQQISIIGFWTGGKEWKVNFVPPYTGKWKYKSISADKSLNGKTGSFEVIEWSDQDKISNPARRGFVRVNKTGPVAGHFFEYSDGTPFLWIGDTWWNWTKKEIHFETYKGLVDDRSKKGFNYRTAFYSGKRGTRKFIA